MVTNYNEFVDEYGQTANNLMRKYIEKATFLSVLNDIRGKTVLDLACGEGNYTRTIKKSGAAYVVGVDMAEKMVARARRLEEEHPLGIEYILRDVTQLGRIGLFDIVTAVYLLPHAQTEQALIDMAQVMYDNLKPSGRLVTVTDNPDVTPRHMAAPEKFGIQMAINGPIQDGAPIEITVLTEGDPIRIQDYHWSKATYERALRKAGFQKIEWHNMLVSEEGVREYGESYWQDYLASPHIVVLECHK